MFDRRDGVGSGKREDLPEVSKAHLARRRVQPHDVPKRLGRLWYGVLHRTAWWWLSANPECSCCNCRSYSVLRCVVLCRVLLCDLFCCLWCVVFLQATSSVGCASGTGARMVAPPVDTTHATFLKKSRSPLSDGDHGVTLRARRCIQHTMHHTMHHSMGHVYGTVTHALDYFTVPRVEDNLESCCCATFRALCHLSILSPAS